MARPGADHVCPAGDVHVTGVAGIIRTARPLDMRPNSADLERELLEGAARMPFSAFQRLCAMGADRRFVAQLTGAGDVGIAQVTLSASGWEPTGPHRRLLLAVRRDGELVDVAALASHARNEWALRTGMGWALGMDLVDDLHRALAAGRPRMRVRLHATPFDWLAAAGDGLCVLDWSQAALSELRLLGERVTIEVAAGAGERLKAMLAYGGLPRVSETRDGMGIAA